MEVRLRPEERQQHMKIALDGIRQSFLHMRRIGMTGNDLLSPSGVRITMKMADRRRKRCMEMYQQAKSGWIPCGD